MNRLNTLIMNALNVANNQGSGIIWCDGLWRVSVQVVLTGSSPDGTLQLEGSNDQGTSNPNSFVPTNWFNVGSSVAASGTGVFVIPEQEICYEYLKLTWTAISGTGTITARLKALGS